MTTVWITVVIAYLNYSELFFYQSDGFEATA